MFIPKQRCWFIICKILDIQSLSKDLSALYTLSKYTVSSYVKTPQDIDHINCRRVFSIKSIYNIINVIMLFPSFDAGDFLEWVIPVRQLMNSFHTSRFTDIFVLHSIDEMQKMLSVVIFNLITCCSLIFSMNYDFTFNDSY